MKPEVWVTCTTSMPVGKKYTLELCRVELELRDCADTSR